MPDIDGTFVEAVANLVDRPAAKHTVYRQTVLINGGEQTVFDDPAAPQPEPIAVGTLQGVVDYVTAKLADQPVIVHIVTPSQVDVLTPLFGGLRETLTYLTANAVLPHLLLDKYMSVEDFLVFLQTRFVATDARTAVQEHCGKLTAGIESDITDDGISQSVSVKAGITRTSAASFTNPAMLQPFRTFPEIPQPESPFSLRIRRTMAATPAPEIALFDADGGAWRPAAISAIGIWLREKLGTEVTILA